MDLGDFQIIAIALSIIICWTLFALLCSFGLEALVQIKAERGRFMRKYLLKQLYDKSNGINWASLLYMHGTIDLLSRDSGEPPACIEPPVFAKTLIEVAGNISMVQVQKDKKIESSYKIGVLQNFEIATRVLVQSDVISFMTQALKSAKQSIGGADSIISIEKEGQIYDQLVLNIENWYTGMVTSIESWYKKKTRMRLFWFGALLGLLLNVDSIQLFGHFRKNPEATKVVMEVYQKNIETALADTNQDNQRIQLYLGKIDSMATAAQLPVGFDQNIFYKNKSDWSLGGFLLKLLGVLISGFAASFGAPFWYDVLRKLYTKKL
jgi:hypothetical protein